MDRGGEARALARLVERWGGSVSPAILDPRCEIFGVPGIAGAIGYRRGARGCAIALGDPVCADADVLGLVAAFRRAFACTVFAAASARLAARARALGYASIEFGEELIFDPRRAPPRGRGAHSLRRK